MQATFLLSIAILFSSIASASAPYTTDMPSITYGTPVTQMFINMTFNMSDILALGNVSHYMFRFTGLSYSGVYRVIEGVGTTEPQGLRWLNKSNPTLVITIVNLEGFTVNSNSDDKIEIAFFTDVANLSTLEFKPAGSRRLQEVDGMTLMTPNSLSQLELEAQSKSFFSGVNKELDRVQGQKGFGAFKFGFVPVSILAAVCLGLLAGRLPNSSGFFQSVHTTAVSGIMSMTWISLLLNRPTVIDMVIIAANFLLCVGLYRNSSDNGSNSLLRLFLCFFFGHGWFVSSSSEGERQRSAVRLGLVFLLGCVGLVGCGSVVDFRFVFCLIGVISLLRVIDGFVGEIAGKQVKDQGAFDLETVAVVKKESPVVSMGEKADKARAE